METFSSHLWQVSRQSSLVMITHFPPLRCYGYIHLVFWVEAVLSAAILSGNGLLFLLHSIKKYFLSGSSSESNYDEKVMINGHEAMSCNL